MSDPIKIQIEAAYSGAGAKAALKDIQVIEAAAIKAAKSQAVYAQAQARSDQASAKSAQSAAKIATEQAKAGIAAQRLAAEQAKAAGELARTDAAQSRAALSALRLEQAQSKAARGTREMVNGFQVLPRTLERFGQGAVSQFKQVGGAIAGAFAVQQIAQFGAETVTLANRTNDAKTALQALAGSPQLYAEALAVATEQQRKFGGSLEENISGVQGLITVSRSSGVELKKLIDITQRLSIKDPAQGVAGARIALNEALSGDPTSLAKRYEIPKAALAAIRDESTSTADKLAILDKYLNDIGITSEVASGGISKQTQAFNALGASTEAAQVALGTLISTAVAPWAEALSGALQGVADGLTAFSQIDEQSQSLAGNLLASATSFEAYQESAANAANELIQVGVVLPTLSEAQYNYAQSLMQTGMSAAEAAAKAGEMGRVLGDISSVQGRLSSDTQMSAESIAGLNDRLLSLASTSPETAAAVSALSREYLKGNIDAQEFATGVTTLEIAQAAQANRAAEAAQISVQYGSGQREAAVATDEATTAISSETEAIAAEILAKVDAEAKARALAAANQHIASVSGQVVSGALSMADAIALLGSQYGYAADEARRLLSAQGQKIVQTNFANAREAHQMRNAGAGPQEASKSALAFVEQEKAAAKAAQEARAKAARGGGGGGGAAASRVAAEAAANDKIVDLARATADKLAAIDEASAQRRAKAAQSLATSIAQTSADLIASQEANDLDIIGASEDQLADIRAREEAEAQARIATIEAISEARRIADEGDAELAQDVLDQRTAAIAKQQALDEEYNKKKQEFAEDPAALEALKKEYDEATAAAATATQVRIDLAKQEADQRAAQLAADKQAVLEDAAARAAAMDSTGKNASTAQERVAALDSALRNLPTQVTTTVTVKEVKTGGGGGEAASSSGGSGNKAAGGGSFLTHGPTTLTVGDNPGGVEHVQVTPLSGTGQTRVGSGMIALAGGGSVVSGAADDAIARLKNAPGAAIPAAAKVAGKGGGGGSSGGGSSKDALSEINDAIELLHKMAELRAELARVGPGINIQVVNELANEALAVGKALGARMVKVTEEDNKAFGLMADSITDAIDLLSDMASLRNDLVDIGPPINIDTVNALANEALAVGKALGARMVQVTEADNKAFGLMADSIGDAIGLLSDAAKLRSDLADIGPPISEKIIGSLADEAVRVLKMTQSRLLPLSEEQADVIGRYTDAAGASIGLLKDAASLTNKLFLDYQSPSDADLQRFVDDTQRIVTTVDAAAATFQKDGLEAAKAWSETAGSVYSTIQEGLVTADKLRFSDVGIDPAQLQKFVQSTTTVLDSVRGLAGKAAGIDTAGLSTLSGVSTAISDTSAMFGALAAAPYGNMGGGGSTSVSFAQGSIVLNIPPGAPVDTNALLNQLMPGITQRLSSSMRGYK